MMGNIVYYFNYYWNSSFNFLELEKNKSNEIPILCTWI